MNHRPIVAGRRRFLRSLGTAAIVGLAGCSSFDDPQTATGHGGMVTIVLDNLDDTARFYQVAVDWGENNRSRFAGVLQPDERNSEMIATTGTWSPTACRDYRVNAVIESGTPSFEAGCQV